MMTSQQPKHGFVLPVDITPVSMDSESNHDGNTSMLAIHSNSNTHKIENATDMELEAVQPPILPIVPSLVQRRPRSGSEGLDYLAFLAEQERQKLDAPPPTTTATTTTNVVSSSSGCSITMSDTTESTNQCEQQVLHQPQCTSQHRHYETHSVVTPPTTIAPVPQTSSSSSSSSSSDTDDSEAMPPPQPRRPRSVSNPDHMMSMEYQPVADRSVLWNLLSVQKRESHFLLPPNLLRDELAKARTAVVRKAAAEISMTMTPYSFNRQNVYETFTSAGRSSFRESPTIPEHAVYLPSSDESHCDYNNYHRSYNENPQELDDDDYEERPESGDECDYDDEDEEEYQEGTADETNVPTEGHDGNIDTSISSMELLRRARSRLLEDLLSETNTLNGSNDKTITVLPHTLSKYKMVCFVSSFSSVV